MVEVIVNNNHQLSYDESADVLYFSFGDPRPAISEPISDSDLIRVDPDTGEVVGLTLIDFTDRYSVEVKESTLWETKKIIDEIIEQYTKAK